MRLVRVDDVLVRIPYLDDRIMDHLCHDPALCVCAAVFAVRLSAGNSITTASHSQTQAVYYFYGSRWLFFHEMCRHVPVVRTLHEVLQENEHIHFFVKFEFPRPPPGWYRDWSDSTWMDVWNHLTRSLPWVEDRMFAILNMALGAVSPSFGPSWPFCDQTACHS